MKKIAIALSICLILVSSLYASTIIAVSTEGTVFDQLWDNTLGLDNQTKVTAPFLTSKSLVLGPAYFYPYMNNVPYIRSPNGETLSYIGEYVSTGNSAGYFFAPIQLPQGANITQLRLIGFDNNKEYSIYTSLISYTPLNETQRTARIMEVQSAEGFSEGEFDILTYEMTSKTIDNSINSYYMLLGLPKSCQLYGVIIYYTV